MDKNYLDNGVKSILSSCELVGNALYEVSRATHDQSESAGVSVVQTVRRERSLQRNIAQDVPYVRKVGDHCPYWVRVLVVVSDTFGADSIFIPAKTL